MKKILFVLSTFVMMLLVFSGCGANTNQSADSSSSSGSGEKTVLKVGATPVPHEEILEQVKDDLAKEGIDLQITEFNDYVQPNMALNDKELDANFFQHEPYLENFNAEHGMELVNAGGIHIEPMGLYSHKIKNLDEIKDGAQIAIPNDPTNGGRALLLLQQANLIKLKDGIGVKATVQDIVDNPKNIKIQEIEAAQLPRSLDDVDAAVINTNFAVQADLVPTKDALVIEDSSSPYVNIIAVRKGDENRPEIKKLVAALQSEKIKNFIEEKYKGAIVPAF
ncbi:MetQ/NlpA family ABC transporter substrate-binding protein [Pectinatus cerevisiiphilus]|uniref:Lipoprotein n=1 Tax=Pectinatus cerevisiiphilus TaxID=86956 RepID=A0A4R3K791_9FIRM|nr:MetQ/NlpA family ABC transporter substrate-binding protein [Pectinatus cerevisiiphilus]TCS78648.1 D-methionine transport system substrate-binding protein [Pectinatus cerevisiiphilus]